MVNRPPKGLTIEEALRRWGDPDLVIRLDRLKAGVGLATADAKVHLEAEYRDVVEALGQGLMPRLQSGVLRARGLVRGGPVTQGKIDIAPDRWAELEIDYDFDEIAGPLRFVMTAIEIHEAVPDVDDEHHGLAATTKQADQEFEHDPDYRWVRLRGVRFECGPLQARVVRRLHAASRTEEPWANGKELLRQKPAIGSPTIRDLFKSKPNWRQLIKSDGRGLYRLNLSQPGQGGS